MIPFSILFYEKQHPKRKLLAMLGDGPPTPQGGGGGWTKVALPKQAAVSFWTGRDNTMTMSIPLTLGNALTGAQPLGLEHTALLKMWRPDKASVEPPVLKIRSPGDAVPYQSLSWVISDLQWGEAVANNSARRILQHLTVILDEHTPDVRLEPHKIRTAQHGFRKTVNEIYRVRKGDTLASIARHFGMKGGWTELGEMQHPPIRDPRKIHVNQILIIATATV